jgi:hypothetical protein
MMKLIYCGTNIQAQVGDRLVLLGTATEVTIEAIGPEGVTVHGEYEDHECEMKPFTRVVTPEAINTYVAEITVFKGAAVGPSTYKPASAGWSEEVAKRLNEEEEGVMRLHFALSGPEFDAILAGLRLLGQAVVRERMTSHHFDVSQVWTNAGKHEGLPAKAIEALATRLNEETK